MCSRCICAATCSPLSALFEAAARDGVKVVFASSSSIYGAAERYPTPEDTPPRPLSPYGITKLACEHLADAYGREFGLDCVVLRYFNAFGPRQRPDMAFTRIVFALAEGTTFELYGDGDQSRGWTYVSDVVDATMAAMVRRAGHLQRRRSDRGVDERVDRAARADLRTGRSTLAALAAVPGDQRRTSADTTRIRSELGVGAARCRSRKVYARSGSGPRLESPRDEQHSSVRRHRLRARNRPLRLGTRARQALVDRRTRGRRGSGGGRDLLAQRRQRLAGLRPALARPGVLARTARPCSSTSRARARSTTSRPRRPRWCGPRR